jgi:hypothetical protein
VTSRDEAHEPSNRADDPPLSANLLPPVLGLVGIGALACAVWAFGLNANYGGELVHCAVITNDPARLACYDQLATPHPPARGALAPVRIHPPEEIK